jgi:hypothetical protein
MCSIRRNLVPSFLLFSLILPAVVKASKPMDDATVSPLKIRVSSGVIAPALLDRDRLRIPTSATDHPLPNDAEAGLSLTVHANGQLENVKVAKSLNP